MIFKIIIKGSWKEKLLKLRLKKLELERTKEITKWLECHPAAAAKADDITTLFRSETLDKIDFQIEATTRLLISSTKN